MLIWITIQYTIYYIVLEVVYQISPNQPNKMDAKKYLANTGETVSISWAETNWAHKIAGEHEGGVLLLEWAAATRDGVNGV